MIPMFDPIKTFSPATESGESPLPVEMAYNVEEELKRSLRERGSPLDATETGDDELDELHQQFMDIQAMYPTPDELDGYLTEFRAKQHISTDDVIAIEQKWPGLIVNSGIAIEQYTPYPSKVNFTATLESLAVAKDVIVLIAALSAVIKLVMWIGNFNKKRTFHDDIMEALNGDKSPDEVIENIKKLMEAKKGEIADALAKAGSDTVSGFGNANMAELAKALNAEWDVAKLLGTVNSGELLKLLCTPIVQDKDKFFALFESLNTAMKSHGDEVKEFINKYPQWANRQDVKKVLNNAKKSGENPVDMSVQLHGIPPPPPTDFYAIVSKGTGVVFNTTEISGHKAITFNESSFAAVITNIKLPSKPTKDKKPDPSSVKIFDDSVKLLKVCIEYHEHGSKIAGGINIEAIKKSLQQTLQKYQGAVRSYGAKIGDAAAAAKAAVRSDNANNNAMPGGNQPPQPATNSYYGDLRKALEASAEFDDPVTSGNDKSKGGAPANDGTSSKSDFTIFVEKLKTCCDQTQDLLTNTFTLTIAIFNLYSKLGELADNTSAVVHAAKTEDNKDNK